jgi:hypothetical protein
MTEGKKNNNDKKAKGKSRTRDEIQAEHVIDDGRRRRGVFRRSGGCRVSRGSVDFDGVRLEVEVLARVVVEELGVGEAAQVFAHAEGLIAGGLLRVEAVEVAEVLRHIGTATATAVCRHDVGRCEMKSTLLPAFFPFRSIDESLLFHLLSLSLQTSGPDGSKLVRGAGARDERCHTEETPPQIQFSDQVGV